MISGQLPEIWNSIFVAYKILLLCAITLFTFAQEVERNSSWETESYTVLHRYIISRNIIAEARRECDQSLRTIIAITNHCDQLTIANNSS